MKKWVCGVCGWIYDEAAGDPDYDLAPGVAFKDLPDDFVCPLCGKATKLGARFNEEGTKELFCKKCNATVQTVKGEKAKADK